MDELANMNDTELLAGTNDEKQDRILLFLRDVVQQMKAVNTRIDIIEKRYEVNRKVTDAKIEKQEDATKNLTEIVMKQG